MKCPVYKKTQFLPHNNIFYLPQKMNWRMLYRQIVSTVQNT